MAFYAVVYSSLSGVNPGTQVMRLDNAVQSGTMNTALPGGFTQCSLTLAPGWRQPWPESAHLEIYADGHAGRKGVVWEGRITRVSRTGRDATAIQASGYGTVALEDDFLEAPTQTSEVALDSSVCLERALAASSSLITLGSTWQTSGVQHALSLFNERTASQVAQQVTAEAGFDFAVWDGRQAWFGKRTAPSASNYLVPADQCTAWEEDEAALWTSVRVKYTDSSSNTVTSLDYTDPEAETLVSVSRRTIQSIGTTDAAGAYASAVTFVEKSKFPVVRASVGPVAAMRTPEGQRVPGHDVRSWQWVTVQGRTPQIIVQTSLDWKSGNITAQLGQPMLNQAGVMSEIVRVVRAVKTASNPLTGSAA